jgi:phage terminase small subunit
MFCDEYLKAMNATRAYMAIYNAKSEKSAQASASRLLSKDEVKMYIDKETEKAHDDTIADANEVMRYFTSVMRGEVELPPRERNKAAELLAKRYKLLTERVEVVDTPVIVDDI